MTFLLSLLPFFDASRPEKFTVFTFFVDLKVKKI